MFIDESGNVLSKIDAAISNMEVFTHIEVMDDGNLVLGSVDYHVPVSRSQVRESLKKQKKYFVAF